jgi:hypothetical protein
MPKPSSRNTISAAARAKRDTKGLSVPNSKLADEAPRVLRSLRGSLKKGDLSEFRKHLRKKYL